MSVNVVDAMELAKVVSIDGNTIVVDRSGYARVGDVIYITSPGDRVYVETHPSGDRIREIEERHDD